MRKNITQNPPKNSLFLRDKPEITIITSVKSIWSLSSDLSQNFKTAPDNPYHAYSIGTTYERTRKGDENTKEPILDGTDAALIFDEEGVCVGISAAVADGLGHAFEEDEAQAKAKLSQQLTQNFVSSVLSPELIGSTEKEAAERLQQLNAEALKTIPSQYQSQNEATLAGIVALLNDKEEYDARAVNVGDCAIVIYHKDTDTVELLPPVVSMLKDTAVAEDKVREVFTPLSAERATEQLTAISHYTLKAGDVVFLMSDGYWQEFPIDQVNVQNVGRCDKDSLDGNPLEIIKKENLMDVNAIKKVIQSVQSSNKHPTAEDYRQAFHLRMLSNTSESREDYRQLYEIISTIDTNNKTPVSEWLKTLEKDPVLVSRINAYIKESQSGDGQSVSFDDDVGYLRFAFESNNFGDDCVLQVLVMPNPKLEVIRRCIEQPEDISKLMLRLEGLKKEELEEYITILLNEKNNNTLSYHPFYNIREAVLLLCKEFGFRNNSNIFNLCSKMYVAIIKSQLNKNQKANKEVICSIKQQEIEWIGDNKQLDNLLGLLREAPTGKNLLSSLTAKPYKAVANWILHQIKENREQDQEYQNHAYDNRLYDEIHHAANIGYLNVLSELIEKEPKKINCKGEYNRTPLHMAVFRLDVNTVQFLLKKGANPNAQTSEDANSETPFHILITKASVANDPLQIDAINKIAQLLLDTTRLNFHLLNSASHTVSGSALHHLENWGDESEGLRSLCQVLLDSEQLKPVEAKPISTALSKINKNNEDTKPTVKTAIQQGIYQDPNDNNRSNDNTVPTNSGKSEVENFQP